MAYQTGVSSSIADLMSQLVTFAVANGWTNSGSWTSGAKNIQSLKIGSSDYINFEYDATTLLLNTSVSITSSGLISAQGSPASSNLAILPISGPHVGYHFFTDGKSFHCVVEVVTGVFTHFNFGMIEKNGIWTGGTYVTGTNTSTNSGTAYLNLFSAYNGLPFYAIGAMGSASSSAPTTAYGHIRSAINGANRLAGIGVNMTGADNAFGTLWSTDMGRAVLDCSPNASNGRAVIAPIALLQGTTGSAGPFYQLGHVANAGGINIANLDPKSIVNTDWMVFPIGQKNGPATVYINSLNYAMAYKK